MKMTQAMEACHRDFKNAVSMGNDNSAALFNFLYKSSRKLFYSLDEGKVINVF